ncbi:Guanosine-diphosphatase [Komagataella kurtzmanii]|nr:Guanosine-diphosphatase [Komagataella kurtzmanii]
MSGLFSTRHSKYVFAGIFVFGLFLFLLANPSSGNPGLPKMKTPSTGSGGRVIHGLEDEGENIYPGKTTPVVTPKTPNVDGEVISKNPGSEDSTGVSGSTSPVRNGSSSDCGTEYVVMIDAGSSGSRVHVYSFDTCFSPPKLLGETFEMLKPGLSSFDTDTVGAAKSLDPLLKVAVDAVPKEKQACTPVSVKATAGLRLLGPEKSDNILKKVRSYLEEQYPFSVVEGDGVAIMEGSDEGVYAWITTNYLLGNIGSAELIPTVAVFDLGGGSTQIVFEPKEGEKMLPGEHKYEIEFGGRHFTLYQYSHLGYGLMQGREKINALVIETALKNGNTKLKKLDSKGKEPATKQTLVHPCLPPAVTASDVRVKLENGDSYIVDFVSPLRDDQSSELASTSATQCRYLAETVLNKDLECKTKSCSFNGIYQPSLTHQFETTRDMYIFSFFYDRLQPLGFPSSFTLDEVKDITKLVCSGSTFWNQFLFQPESVHELENEPLWCLDLSFMVALLHTGYEIPLSRELHTAKKIKDNELGWCLGASLPLLDNNANWKCRVA